MYIAGIIFLKMEDGSFITQILSLMTLLVDIVVVFIAACLFMRGGIADRIVKWIGRRAIGLAFFFSFGGLVGSLFFSEVAGFEPCVLCWVQRVFLYPQVVILGLAWIWQDRAVIPYSLALSVLGGLVALYHAFTNLGGHSFLPCTAVGGECSRIYVLEYGYITIPMMALTAFAVLIVIMLSASRTDKLSRV